MLVNENTEIERGIVKKGKIEKKERKEREGKRKSLGDYDVSRQVGSGEVDGETEYNTDSPADLAD